MERLDYLVELGVTAVELMPVADFPGARNWGYDGVLPFAPDSRYGRPEDLKALIQAAHAKGLMVLLDVVYNHFGPEGNYLHVYAKAILHRAPPHPVGRGDQFRRRRQPRRCASFSSTMRCTGCTSITSTACAWMRCMRSSTTPSRTSSTELAERVHASIGRKRQVHLVLENDANEARYLGRGAEWPTCTYAAQWNDDIHHALHVLTDRRDRRLLRGLRG